MAGGQQTMKVNWCWICRREHPMLDDAMFDAVWRAYQAADEAQPTRADGTLYSRLTHKD